MGRHVGHELRGQHLARLEHRGVEQGLQHAAGAARRGDDVHVLAVLAPRRAATGCRRRPAPRRSRRRAPARRRCARRSRRAPARAAPGSRSPAAARACGGSCAPTGSRPPPGSAEPAAPLARAPRGAGRASAAARGRRQRLALARARRSCPSMTPRSRSASSRRLRFARQEVAVAAGVDERRRVRQHGERRRLGPRELPGITTEVAPGRRVEADRVAPERRIGGVEPEHLRLRERRA